MAKSKAPSILEIIPTINKGTFQPVYYLFGVDYYHLQNALDSISKAVSPLITSDFDKETFYGDKNSLSEVLDFAAAFPFGSEKKLIVFKQFEKVKDKKPLTGYAESPADFTVLVLIHNGTIANLNSEPYKTLGKYNFIFEAKELKGKNLLNWFISHVGNKDKTISQENAQLLIDITGESRSMLENQAEKIITFMGEEKEISLNHIQSLSTRLKQFSIFDLQNAVGKKDKDSAMNIAFNLLDNSTEPVFIVAMLTRYFTGVSRVGELTKEKIPSQQAARIVGTHPYYYKDYQKARSLFSDTDLANVFRSLLQADLSIKTTAAEGKNIITILISEILS
jgi:DNA polymerase-3 subunit delta